MNNDEQSGQRAKNRVCLVNVNASGASLALLLAIALSCGGDDPRPDPWLSELRLTDVQPATLVPHSLINIEGSRFVDGTLGTTELHLSGRFTASDGTASEVNIDVGPLSFVDFEHMQVAFAEEAQGFFPSLDGDFDGEAWVEVKSVLDGVTYESEPIALEFALRSELKPSLSDAQTGELFFVNDRVDVRGEGFFLSDGEGTTTAVVTGCFRAGGIGACVDVEEQAFPLVAEQSNDRQNGHFVLSPDLVGIAGGVFEGAVEIVNRHAGGAELRANPIDVTYEFLPPTLFSVDVDGISLGQYVQFLGGGFVSTSDGDGSGGTELFLDGGFTPAGSGTSVPVDLLLLPEVLEGRTLRYVMNEDDELGRAIDLREVTGTFVGRVRLRVAYDGVVQVGEELPINFELKPVKQVVHLRFLPDYVNTLRHFGLRAVDREIRERVLAVVARDYAGVNLEVRQEVPADFALYATVDIAGEDLNGLGLLGYDNTAGKDVGNVRLYDHIGGVNAVTQQDGYPGFGGVFIESMFAFSKHPKGLADGISGADELFDESFDPFRPDMGKGKPVSASDFPAGGIGVPIVDPGCPATSRPKQIECAVWVLGNMIGTTVSHEIAHSLGLANPDLPGAFHNEGDEENRLMDNGGDRPFAERAQLEGQGPGRFCRGAYDYLREILPSDAPANYEGRESCF